jgi:hypothetical protein
VPCPEPNHQVRFLLEPRFPGDSPAGSAALMPYLHLGPVHAARSGYGMDGRTDGSSGAGRGRPAAHRRGERGGREWGGRRSTFISRPFVGLRGADPSRLPVRIRHSGRSSPSTAESFSIPGKDSSFGPPIAFEGRILLDFREGFVSRPFRLGRGSNPSRPGARPSAPLPLPSLFPVRLPPPPLAATLLHPPPSRPLRSPQAGAGEGGLFAQEA